MYRGSLETVIFVFSGSESCAARTSSYKQPTNRSSLNKEATSCDSSPFKLDQSQITYNKIVQSLTTEK